jgi:hypothetical protein
MTNTTTPPMSRGFLPPRTVYKPNSPPTSDHERDERESEVMLKMFKARERRQQQQRQLPKTPANDN